MATTKSKMLYTKCDVLPEHEDCPVCGGSGWLEEGVTQAQLEMLKLQRDLYRKIYLMMRSALRPFADRYVEVLNTQGQEPGVVTEAFTAPSAVLMEFTALEEAWNAIGREVENGA